MTNLKQVTLESDDVTVSSTNPLPITEPNTDINEQILTELRSINLHLTIITNQIFSNEDIKEK